MPVTKKKTKRNSKVSKSSSDKILVIVESPSKAKTISKYLGAKYKVIASVGHVRDLPKSKLGIDLDNDFEPQYIAIRGKGSVIKEMRKEAEKAKKTYIATDPDREGEAISWHIAYLLGIDPSSECRIEFHEITKEKVKEAVKKPRAIKSSLVDAQQARRVLDRLVGYEISPLLWRKVRKGLSAGRVQSVALKMICDRESAIKAFVPEEYWNISAEFTKGESFAAKLLEYKGKKIKVQTKEQSDEIVNELSRGEFKVMKLTKRNRSVNPFPPFTTSTMQQEASSRLNFNTRKTMMIAQQLYEGIDVKGRGTTGLITYLRTDSVRVSDVAKEAAYHYISDEFGKEYIGNTKYSNKKKEIQDAHEAIRPSMVSILPSEIKASLTQDQYKLYNLIWVRFIASQMSQAKYSGVSADISNGDYTFRASGSNLIFEGFRKLYKVSDSEKNKMLPPLVEGEKLKADTINAEQLFTQPPARYTEATLVKDLEEKNIGRPSTYAPIVSTLSDRKYIIREKKMLKPTELGFVVNDLMKEYFKEIVDVKFTSNMEDTLDNIEMKSQEWKDVIRDFYGPFEKAIERADKAIEKVKVEDVPTGEMCQVCGKPMVKKMGRFGEFVACSGYPECKNTKTIVQSTGVKCPNCGGDLIVRRSKRGRIFYGCSGYPKCKTVFWNKPVNKKCSKCGSVLLEKKSKNYNFVCSNENCGYNE